MAIAPEELATLRQEMALAAHEAQEPVTWTKETINDVLAALDLQYENTCRGHLAAAMEAAAPSTFSPAQKLALGKAWMRSRVRRGV